MSKSILPYPYPFQSWLALASDPDNTLLKDWEELDKTIWQELELPFGDSLFVRSYNNNLKEQVNLVDFPHIAQAHLHDTIHTWGDYMHARQKGFDRADALETISILQQHQLTPKVWIDHSQFIGNLLHNSRLGSIPQTKDKSGHVYINFNYTLDLIKKLGIRYIWDGEITSILGQDKKLKTFDYFIQTSASKLKACAKYILYLLSFKQLRRFQPPNNEQYFPYTFPDGTILYCFRRYGTWADADINGLYNIIQPSKIDTLIQTGGTSIVYTHIGKRHIDSMQAPQHIPNNTLAALQYLKKQFDAQKLMLSSVSKLLDYLILRDNTSIDYQQHKVIIRLDKIRFELVSPAELKGQKISFYKKNIDLNQLKVVWEDTNLDYKLQIETQEVVSILF